LPFHQLMDLRTVPLYFAYKRTSRTKEHFKETFHAHQGIEILLVHEGNGTLIIDQKSYQIHPGLICIFQPFQLHHVQMDVSEQTPFIRSILHYEPTLYESYFDKWPALRAFFKHIHKGALPHISWYDSKNLDRLAALLQDLQEKLPELSHDQHYEEFSLCLVSFFHTFKPLWEKQHTEHTIDQSARAPHQVEQILEWLDNHYAEPLSLVRMSLDLHLSRHHLSHLFKKSTGSSITDYLSAKRMQQAAQRLIAKDVSIGQIAEEVGITNSSYFCKLFKTHYGLTPHRYRKQFR
jgi:AraC family transcriptional regulator of arabinose operon